MPRLAYEPMTTEQMVAALRKKMSRVELRMAAESERAVAKRKTESERIGNPTREKWTAFLGQALQDGYLDEAEFTRRMEAVMAAAVMADINAVLTDLPTEDWNDAWQDLRKQGKKPGNTIVPRAPQDSKNSGSDVAVVAYLVAVHLAVVALAVLAVLGI